MSEAPIVVELKPYESADPGKCGSCQLFRRIQSSGGGDGYCTFVPPPHIARVPSSEQREEPARTYDTKSCSFYRASHAQFAKRITWFVPPTP